MTKHDFKVVVGEHDLELSGDEQEYHNVKEIIIHPEFNPLDFENDFAILKLDKLVTISRKADIINLPSETLSYLSGHTAQLFGWGLNENETASSTLKEITMEILSNQVCKNSFMLGKTKLSSLTTNHICGLSLKNDSATCSGDSGGKQGYF